MYVLTIALRHLRSRSITWVAMALIAIIVALYLLIISVLEGVKDHYMDKLQSVLAHATVTIGKTAGGIVKPEAWAAELAGAAPGIRGVTAGLEVPAMALFDKGRTVGTLRGVDLERELKFGRLKEFLDPKGLAEFGTHEQGGKALPGCIVGKAWQKDYDLAVGGRVTFVFTDEDEDDPPRAVAFAIIGFFGGDDALLEQAAYVDRQFLADKLLVSGKAKTLAVWVDDPNRADLGELKTKLRAKMTELVQRDSNPRLVPYIEIETWQEKESGFYVGLTRDNLTMRFIMSVFLALISFVIFLIFGRLVAEKVRDIGALRALGATPAGIRACFLLQGFVIGALGLGAGLLLASVVISNVNPIAEFFHYDPFPADTFGGYKIPTHTLAFDVIVISALSLVSAVVGAFFPAWRAAKLNPVECLRHE